MSTESANVRKRKTHDGGRRMKNQVPERLAGMPLVSIITVVLNQAAALERTINSVLGQTYKSIEYIIVDGQSTDGTLDVIRKHDYAIDYFISEPDVGEYDATNKGIALATGDHICLLNAADEYRPKAIELMVKRAEASPDSIIYTDYRYGDRDITAPDEITPAFNIYNMQIAHQSLMVPRYLYTKKIGLYRTDFRIVSDHIWMREAYRFGVKFCRVPYTLLDFDNSGISSGQTSLDRRLFEAEVASRINLFYPFVPIDIARHIYKFIHASDSLRAVVDWIKVAQREEPVADESWIDFEQALKASVQRISQQRSLLLDEEGWPAAT